MPNPDLGDSVFIWDINDKMRAAGQIFAHRANQTLVVVATNAFMAVETDKMEKDPNIPDTWHIVTDATIQTI